jgi:hypothetical protein
LKEGRIRRAFGIIQYRKKQATNTLYPGSSGYLVEKNILQAVIESIGRKAAVNNEEVSLEDEENLSSYLHVIDAFSVPRWVYIVDEKAFTQ